jgi:hypothetical protein
MLDNPTDDANHGQAGARLLDLIARIVRARRRLAVSEGEPPDMAEPLPEAIAGTRALFDDDDPRLFDIKWSFLEMVERGVIDTDRRLSRALGIAPIRRRRDFVVIDAGKR